MLARLVLALAVGVFTSACTLAASMVLASMISMLMRLSLHGHRVIFSCLGDRVYKDLVAIWPFSLELLFLVIFSE